MIGVATAYVDSSAVLVLSALYVVSSDLAKVVLLLPGILVGFMGIVGVVQKTLVFKYRQRTVRYSIRDPFGDLSGFVGTLQDACDAAKEGAA